MAVDDGVLDRAGEDTVTAIVEASARAMLAHGLDVIVDSTNLFDPHIDRWHTVAQSIPPTRVEVVHLAVGVEECIRRCVDRGEHGGRMVPLEVIRDLANQSGVGLDYPQEP
jgi:tRNA uridine 5-carbamoylmethylation protein Kti12